MTLLNILLMIIALWGFAYTLYCQTKARANISKEKLANLKDPRRTLKGPMPPKTILTTEGLKYYRGYYIGTALFAICILAILLINTLTGITS